VKGVCSLPVQVHGVPPDKVKALVRRPDTKDIIPAILEPIHDNRKPGRLGPYAGSGPHGSKPDGSGP